ISVLAFVGVAALVGMLAFVLGSSSSEKTLERLDTLTGKRKPQNALNDILKKSAFESDKKSLLEFITPNFLSLQKICIQADCHIKPSTLVGVGLGLAFFGATVSWLVGVKWFFAPLAGLVLFTVPYLWLLNKRRGRLKSFASQLPDALELVAR